jgi:hypothetical protein
MPEDRFWRMTPRKFFALVEMHRRANDPDYVPPEKKKEIQQSQKMTPQDFFALKMR